MTDESYTECIRVECATKGCKRVHVFVFLENHTMNPEMLVHCMSCLSTMQIRIASKDKETGEYGVERRMTRTSEQMREVWQAEVDKRCHN